MKKRNQIDQRYKWDLTKFCKDEKQWYEDIEKLKQIIPGFQKFKGKLNNPDMLLGYFNLAEDYYKVSSKLNMYCSNFSNTDLTNSKYVEMENIISTLDNELSVSVSYYAPEMLSYSDDYFKSLLADDKFKNYHFSLYNLQRSKAHVLSEAEERIISGSTVFAGEFSKVYHALVDANIKFNKIKNKDGKELPLTLSNYSVYLSHKDRVLRENAFKEIYGKFESFDDTISSNYIASLKADWFYAQVSKFSSVLNEHLFPDNISENVYTKLVDNVNSNLNLLHEYYKLKGKMLNLKDFTYYDLYLSPVKPKTKIPFEEALNIVCDALSVLGDNYVNLLRRSFSERWIDVYPNEGKRSGAYQSDCYGVTPIVLLNYEGLTDDVFTLAHELGHAMHSYHSNEKQPINLAGYTIFLAEVASTVNEVLLLKYLYNNSNNKKEKIYYLEHYLQMFKGTIYRQTMFSEFEDYAHKLIETNKPISKNVLKNYYGSLNKKYQGKPVKHKNEIEYEWLRIPHFYTPYYVYKYATGLVSAISIASKIYNNQQGALENYINYLSAGGSNFSIETLKNAGVNLETNDPYDEAFAEMKWAIDELKKLV